MSRPTTLAVLATAVLAVAGITVTSVPAASAGTRPQPNDFPVPTVSTPLSGAVAVSPTHGASTEADQVALLAGSADHLVFARGADATTDPSIGTEHLYLADAAGEVVSLGTSPTDFGWSIVGDLLTSTPTPTGTTVRWIDVANGTSGSGTMPSGAYYLGATATGWAYVRKNALFTETTAGVTTDLGRPLGNASGEDVTSGGTGPDGAVVVDSTSAAAYVPYADPTHPVVLDTLDLSHHLASNPVYMQCGVQTSAAVCGESFNTFPNSYETGERLSLTGGAPVAVRPHNGDFFDDFAFDAQTTATASEDDLTVTAANGSNRTSETNGDDYQVISAFGAIVQTNSASTALETFHTPGQAAALLVAPTLSPIQSGAASQSSGRIVFVDDQKSGRGGDAQKVWSRPVRNVNGHLVLGPAQYVGALDDDQDSDGPFQGPLASSATTAYLRTVGLRQPPYVLARPAEPRSWHSGGTDSIQTLSGNRVLTRWGRVLDTTSKQLRSTRPSGGRAPYAALWGDEYCYLGASGAVACIDLVTGRRTTVFTPSHADRKPAFGQLWLSGDHLAWVDQERGPRVRVVSLRHPSSRVVLPTAITVDALTSNGILLDRDSSSTRTDTYYLQGYGKDAHPVKVLTSTGAAFFRELPVDVDQSVLTWDDNGTIMAAPLPHVADPPRFLGAPVAPRRLTRGSGNAWRAYLPYSASLTRCSVTISRGHTVLRRLACVNADLAEGGVVVSWDGRSDSGRLVAPGPVAWTVHAANADGRAEAGDGSRHAVSGTIQISS